ncbi:MAG: zinc-dependent metalloprotease, partial [Acidobacteriota bacterium]
MRGPQNKARRGEAHLNEIGRTRSRTVGIVFAILALGAALPSLAVTVRSPLHFPQQEGLAVKRAAEAGERLVDLDVRALGELRQVVRGQSFRLEAFPFAPGATGDLLLERFEVASPDAKLLVQTARGTEVLPMPAVAHFRGHLEGEPDSRVYVGIPGSFLVAIVKSSAGIMYVGPEGGTDGPVQHVLRPADSPLNDEYAPASWVCGADELPPPTVGREEPSLRPLSALTTQEASALKEAIISIETDQEMLAKYAGNATAMTAYITTLVGEASVIYERDLQVHLTVNVVQAWATTDPYSSTALMGQLEEVGDWWHANRPKASYPRSTVHYMSGKPVTGGIAWMGVLCIGDFSQGGHWGGAYGVTQLNGYFPGSPWDLIAFAHELGHNFGSPHTHCYSPPIDTCYAGESGCYSGSVTNPGPLGGTIMSYCHLLIGGYANLDFRFHDRCITERMLPAVNAATCLGTFSGGGGAAPAARFYTVAPCRVVDTRNAPGPYGGPALAANTDRTFVFAGQCGIPTSATAVSGNVTVVQSTAAGNNFPSGIRTMSPVAPVVMAPPVVSKSTNSAHSGDSHKRHS